MYLNKTLLTYCKKVFKHIAEVAIKIEEKRKKNTHTHPQHSSLVLKSLIVFQ